MWHIIDMYDMKKQVIYREVNIVKTGLKRRISKQKDSDYFTTVTAVGFEGL